MGLRLVMCLGSLSCLGMRVTRPIFCLGGEGIVVYTVINGLSYKIPNPGPEHLVEGRGYAGDTWGFVV